MERITRIDGVKFHLNRLSDDELQNMRMYAIARVSGVMHDVEVIETELEARRPVETLNESGWNPHGEYIERTDVAQQYFSQRFREIQ